MLNYTVFREVFTAFDSNACSMTMDDGLMACTFKYMQLLLAAIATCVRDQGCMYTCVIGSR